MENRRERENRKQKLREGIIDSGTVAEEEPLEQDNSFSEDRKKHRRFRVVITLLMVGMIAAGLLGYKYYQVHHQYQKVSVKWEKELGDGSFSGYENYGENVV